MLKMTFLKNRILELKITFRNLILKLNTFSLMFLTPPIIFIFLWSLPIYFYSIL